MRARLGEPLRGERAEKVEWGMDRYLVRYDAPRRRAGLRTVRPAPRRDRPHRVRIPLIVAVQSSQ